MLKIKSIVDKYFKNDDKNKKFKIGLLIVIGLILILFPSATKKTESSEVTYVSNEAISNDTYIENEEKRIEEFISGFSGVNKVKVLLSMSSGKEKILAKELKETKDESSEDYNSGEVHNKKSNTYEESTVYKSDDNPYVLKENEPSLRGIIILIDGNINITLISNIKDAMKAYLDLPTNKVQVYKMKG